MDGRHDCVAGYAKLEPGSFRGQQIDIALEYRTHIVDGLLMFSFGERGTYALVQLEAGSLQWKLSVGGHEYLSTLDGDNSNSLCDGQWQKVQLGREGLQMTIRVGSRSSRSPMRQVEEVKLSSYLYLGGIPDDDREVQAFIRDNQLEHLLQPSLSFTLCYRAIDSLIDRLTGCVSSVWQTIDGRISLQPVITCL